MRKPSIAFVVAIILFSMLELPAIRLQAGTRVQTPEESALGLEQAMFDAIKSKDVSKMAAILSDDFQFRDGGHPSIGKQEFLKAMGSLSGEILSVGSTDLEVRVLGDTVVVSGTQRATMRTPEGTVASGDTLFTDVFQKRGPWRLVFAHSVELPDAK